MKLPLTLRKIEASGWSEEYYRIIANDSYFSSVASCWDRDDATQIVQAVNSHDELVEAGADLLRFLPSSDLARYSEHARVVARFRAALEKAGAKP